MINVIDTEGEISDQKVVYLIEANKTNYNIDYNEILKEVIVTSASGRVIKAKTVGQKRYIDMINTKDVTFGIGPAGTGKTYLAVAAAVNAFRKKEVERIILTRPAVEAGEKLGFLPGDLQDKVDPYLRPLYDALFDIMGIENFMKNVEKQLIEVAPLAYMRGRTLDSSFIILDEAQNTTNEQMKMFLTRLGYGSKAVITGDITQIDLPGDKKSGLKSVINILKDVEDIGFMFFHTSDVVRHKLVQDIIKAYERFEAK
jgi:phosphate starvation-inducible PhoH-like protein